MWNGAQGQEGSELGLRKMLQGVYLFIAFELSFSSRHLLPLNWETLRIRNTVSPVLTVYPDDNLVTQVMELVLKTKHYSKEDTVSEMCIRVTSVNHMT